MLDYSNAFTLNAYADAEGFVRLQPFWGGSAPLTLANETRVVSVYFGLNSGTSWDSLPEDCIHLATQAEVLYRNQPAACTVNSATHGSLSYMHKNGASESKMTTVPVVGPTNFSFATAGLPAYTGEQAVMPTISDGTMTHITTASSGELYLTAQTIAGENVEYTRGNADGPTLAWRDSNYFSGLGIHTHYFYARVKESATHAAGAISPVGAIDVVAATREITVTAPTFAEAPNNYASVVARDITIANSGNYVAVVNEVVVSDTSKFTVSGNGGSVGAGASINTWKIAPVAGLTPGTHTATITVTYETSQTKTATVSFTVSVKGDYTGTQATTPVIVGGNTVAGIPATVVVTAQTISSETVEYATATTATAPTTSWQDSNSFSGVAAGTHYFFARVKETVTHTAGTVATSAAVTVVAAVIASDKM